MNKLFIAFAALTVISFSSCKSNKEKVEENVENTQKQLEETVSTQLEEGQENVDKIDDFIAELPTFSSPEANEWTKKYAELAKEMKVAATTGDQDKLAELTKQAVDLSSDLRKITQKLTPEDAKKINDWTSKIQKELGK
ncbi:hypothetical protein [Chishuiella sp.]|uniref:hypothetical protein n=1 Tax=Chishuiella sp. TaxID=1969467 RepID=UPI0028A93159|nr:hypothetical protein [Chishuiella sp.]